MSQIESAVARHYGGERLTHRVLEALQRAGKATDTIDPDDLAPVDEFHLAGREATALLAPRLELGSGQHLLDLGSGIGGPARYLARTLGCRVTGVDLTPGFVATAEELTRRAGLSGKVSFQTGSVTALAFPAGNFDAATLFHVGMNLPDKEAMAREVHRVLKPGGRFLLYDIMRTGTGEPAYPMPWAREPATSFLARPQDYRQALERAGFAVEPERSHIGLAKDFLARMRARMAEPKPPQLGLFVLLGETAKPAFANLTAAIDAGLVAPVEILARKPG